MDSLNLWRLSADVRDRGLRTTESGERNAGQKFFWGGGGGGHSKQLANEFDLRELD
jgi:hypothetical protein